VLPNVRQAHRRASAKIHTDIAANLTMNFSSVNFATQLHEALRGFLRESAEA
jgi:hypothetical protein